MIYYTDLTPDSPDFAMVQYLGLKGYLSGWEARLEEPVSRDDLDLWNALSANKLNVRLGETKRVDVLRQIYNAYLSDKTK